MEPGKLIKVAVFPASSEVGMEVIRCLSDHKDIEVIGVDSEPGPAKHICEDYIDNAPWVSDIEIKDYFNYFDFVFPCNEAAIYKKFNNAVSHPSFVIDICHSKTQTYLSFPHMSPQVYPAATWVKPDTGHSGIGQYKSEVSGINCEYLPGEEYTVDCFSQNKQLWYFHPRKRTQVRSGIAVSTESVIHCNSEFSDVAHEINLLGFTGSWFFQCKRDLNGSLKLLEIGARVSGSSGHSRAAGVNLPLLHLYSAMGINVEIPNSQDTKINRYLTVRARFPQVNKIYFDWDDTIMIKGKINWKAIALAYKLGIECHILTRKENAQLIPPFQSIIVSENKAEYSTKDTLLIDDSFAERKQWINSLSPQQIDLYL